MTTDMIPAPTFRRSPDNVLTLVRLTGDAGELRWVCSGLGGLTYPYLVQVTTPSGDVVGLCDLDGDRVSMSAEWVAVTEAPAEVVEHIIAAWEATPAAV